MRVIDYELQSTGRTLNVVCTKKRLEVQSTDLINCNADPNKNN